VRRIANFPSSTVSPIRRKCLNVKVICHNIIDKPLEIQMEIIYFSSLAFPPVPISIEK
jgi:hypothetical protein